MKFKEKLIKLRAKISERAEKVDSMNTTTNLEDKVDDYIDWYFENMVKGNYTYIGEYHLPRKMRDLIEKIAVWYELRYPNYEINKLMPGSEREQIDVNDVMFQGNPYASKMFDDLGEKELSWSDFYNANVFMNSLPREERYYFSKPRCRDIVYLNPNSRSAHLHLIGNEFVEMAEEVTSSTNSVIRDEELKGLSIQRVLELFNEKGIKLPKDNGLEEEIKKVDKLNCQREGLLDCAMYRIIERGGRRIGPRRAFLFAKEFDRNIDIPMMYAIDMSDPGLSLFINEYLKAGGSEDLVCYNDYFSKISREGEVDTISIRELKPKVRKK